MPLVEISSRRPTNGLMYVAPALAAMSACVGEKHSVQLVRMPSSLLKQARSEEHTSELQSRGHLVPPLFPYTTLFRSAPGSHSRSSRISARPGGSTPCRWSRYHQDGPRTG